ncbi:hypothetical protein AMTR_s00142p00088250 [Amborella trichopoda]|uniref:Uncharacterized protein n=1 Tax=Amborella trichopoda TaxID=13333 RepID=W1PG50_AMBTC|nr:hypothetical protein AMTR_s00142p00088250 [Amborella trichopoda]
MENTSRWLNQLNVSDAGNERFDRLIIIFVLETCAKDLDVCAKCSCCVDRIIGRDISEVEAERKLLEESIKNARERDRRTLLRAMGNGKDGVRGKSLRSAETMKETTGEASNDEPVEQGSDKDDETEFAELSDEG